jgi:hypothetical protein
MIFQVDEYGRVSNCQNFGAVGTGATIAQSVLYQRAQKDQDELNKTLYNVFEAANLATIAPGVGKPGLLCVVRPPSRPGGKVGAKLTTLKAHQRLDQQFKKFGPKEVVGLEPIDGDCLQEIGVPSPPPLPSEEQVVDKQGSSDDGGVATSSNGLKQLE